MCVSVRHAYGMMHRFLSHEIATPAFLTHASMRAICAGERKGVATVMHQVHERIHVVVCRMRARLDGHSIHSLVLSARMNRVLLLHRSNVTLSGQVYLAHLHMKRVRFYCSYAPHVNGSGNCNMNACACRFHPR